MLLSQSDNDRISTDSYAHLFDSVPQGWFAVASIIESLLHNIKINNSKVSKAYLRSDNAGCYHCGPLLAALPGISNRTGIQVCRYDFSEAQSGKDICDRRTAPMKIHAKRYGNEGHNITTAEELKIALESQGGIQNIRVYTSDVDFNKQTMTKCSIPNINQLNNFTFEENGMRMWLAYNIGGGRLITYQELDRISNAKQEETDLKVRNSLRYFQFDFALLRSA